MRSRRSKGPLLPSGFCLLCLVTMQGRQAIPQAEGSLWRAMALLVAGGQLHAAATVLQDAGAVDAAYGLAAACREACAEAGLADQVGVAINFPLQRRAQCPMICETADIDLCMPHRRSRGWKAFGSFSTLAAELMAGIVMGSQPPLRQ